jgi:hypothetical protein
LHRSPRKKRNDEERLGTAVIGGSCFVNGDRRREDSPIDPWTYRRRAERGASMLSESNSRPYDIERLFGCQVR